MSLDRAPTWFSKTFNQYEADSGQIADWLNGLERLPDAEVVGEVSVTTASLPGAELWLLVLATVLWAEHRP